MANKHIFVICYMGIVSRCIPINLIKSTGYKITIEYLNIYEGLHPKTQAEMKNHYPNILKYPFESFDMVIILVCDVVEYAKDFLIPHDLVTKIKEKIKFAEMEKNSSISLIGMNPCLLPVNKESQTKLFDGNFIDKPMMAKKFKSYLYSLVR